MDGNTSKNNMGLIMILHGLFWAMIILLADAFIEQEILNWLLAGFIASNGLVLAFSKKSTNEQEFFLKGRVLTIAGSDPSGGAGIQADIKTITALGGYAMSAVTALTVQNTLGVMAVHQVPLDIIEGQIRACLDDVGADAIKIGMIGDGKTAVLIADFLAAYPSIPVVLDPVLVATSGDSLAQNDVLSIMKERLIPHAALITPNIPEAVTLSDGQEAKDKIVQALKELGAKAILLKGGHDSDAIVQDILYAKEVSIFKHERIETRHTHGTGCTLASAISTGIAQGSTLQESVQRATDYVHKAILQAPCLGAGHGPLNHLPD